ncbi:hypothetical protein [Nonomuraea rhizosphaerae]|nr:hypothetical protein [Nonomuraea rhizosphaerae]
MLTSVRSRRKRFGAVLLLPALLAVPASSSDALPAGREPVVLTRPR